LAIAFVQYATVLQSHDIASARSAQLYMMRDENDCPPKHQIALETFKVEAMSGVCVNWPLRNQPCPTSGVNRIAPTGRKDVIEEENRSTRVNGTSK